MNNLGDPSKGTEDFPSLRELMKGRLGGSFMHCNCRMHINSTYLLFIYILSMNILIPQCLLLLANIS